MTTKDLRNSVEKVLGNNIRCLLPSYWWKRLFHQVADTIDTINGVEIVGSEAKLQKLDAQQGSLATVATRKEMKISECYFPTGEDDSLTDAELFAKLTPLKAIKVNFPLPDLSSTDTALQLVSEDLKNLGFLMLGKGLCTAIFTDVAAGTQKYWILTGQFIVDAVNNFLKEKKFYILDDRENIGEENMALLDSVFTIVDSNTDVYVKGLAWERLAKEGESGSASVPSYTLYYTTYKRNGVTTMADKYINLNKEEYAKISASQKAKENYLLQVVELGSSEEYAPVDAELSWFSVADLNDTDANFNVTVCSFLQMDGANQPQRRLVSFKSDGTAEYELIPTGDVKFLYYADGVNSLSAKEKAHNASAILSIKNSFDSSFTPSPIIIRYKINSTKYLSLQGILSGNDAEGDGVSLTAFASPNQYYRFNYDLATGDPAKAESIQIGGGEGSYDDTEIKTQLAELSAETEVLKEAQQFTDVAIKDLQDMKIDRENDDYYPKMAVGLADNLAGVDVVDSKINFRRSGGGAITDGVARIESIKGNSVVWNQGFKKGSSLAGTWDENILTINGTIASDANSYDITAYNSVFVAPVANHKYYINLEIMSGTIVGDLVYVVYPALPYTRVVLNNSNKVYQGIIDQIDATIAYWFIRTQTTGSEYTNVKVRHVVCDLTQMFGSGNEPTTIEEFYARIPIGVDMNAYNEGEVIHMDVQSVESVGVNQWDEEWEFGKISTSSGSLVDSDTDIRSKNFIPVMPNVEYHYFGASSYYIVYYDESFGFVDYWSISGSRKLVVPNNVRYVKLSRSATTYNHDICINISDPAINGKYFPYIKRVEDLSIIRKYFPEGMKSAGSAHDEIRYNKASGKWEKVVRIGEVNLGIQNWIQDIDNTRYRFEASTLKMAFGKNLFCAKYPSAGTTSPSLMAEKTICVSNSATLPLVRIKDSNYTDAAALKASLQGVMLYYELAEPIVTELDEADQFKDLDYQVWNAGTEKATFEGKSAPLAADITYGFNAIGKIKELESLVAALRAKVGI